MRVTDLLSQSINQESLHSLIKEFPYFNVPFIIEELQKKQLNSAHLERFNINPVLLASLYQELAQVQENNEEVGKTNETSAIDDLLQQEVIMGQDYYAQQGIIVDDSIPDIGAFNNNSLEADTTQETSPHTDEDMDEKSLLVQMSFSEWLQLITSKRQQELEDQKEQEELKNNWRKMRLTEAIEEEVDEIPEDVFKMAVDSIEKEELVSESMAEVYTKQGKYEQALNIYKKLILSFPEKKVYFASKIDIIRNNYNL